MKKKTIAMVLAMMCIATACGEAEATGGRGRLEDAQEAQEDRDEAESKEAEDTPAAEAPEAEVDTEAEAPEEDAAEEPTEAPAEWTGLDFTTQDFDGNTVTAQEIFSAHEYTMVNIWAAWCGPCVGELPELEELSRDFADKDCAIVGYLVDGYDGSELADAKKIASQAGLTYLNIIPGDKMDRVFDVYAVPTSFFVDRNGHVVGEKIEGAWPEGYTQQLKELLGE